MTTPEQLSRLMEFGHVVQVLADGIVTDVAQDMPSDYPYFDEVLYLEPDGGDGDLSLGFTDPWRLMSGYTSQHGYNGPVMHPSEYIGGKLARDILATPGLYVAVLVDSMYDADGTELEESDTEGWAVLTIPAEDNE